MCVRVCLGVRVLCVSARVRVYVCTCVCVCVCASVCKVSVFLCGVDVLTATGEGGGGVSGRPDEAEVGKAVRGRGRWLVGSRLEHQSAALL